MRIQHRKAGKEDDDSPCADCNLQGPRMHRYMDRFFTARGAVATIGFACAHYYSPLLFRIIDHIHAPRPTTITSIMIPPNHGLCILSLLSCLTTFLMFISVPDRLISSHSYAFAKSDRQPNRPSPQPRVSRSILSPFAFFPPSISESSNIPDSVETSILSNRGACSLPIRKLCFTEIVY
jgi:hypothetical protein